MIRILFTIFVLIGMAFWKYDSLRKAYLSSAPKKLNTQISLAGEVRQGQVTLASTATPTGDAPSVRLIFRDSVNVTEDAKHTVQQTIDSYYSFLVALGLTPPRDLPPIGLVPGAHKYWNATYDKRIALNGGMTIGSDSIVEDAAMAYGIWTFSHLVDLPWDDDTFEARLRTEEVFMSYFGLVFLQKDAVPPWAAPNHWLPALLQIRRECGSYFTDMSVATMIPLMKEIDSYGQGARKEGPDEYFYSLFTVGENEIAGYNSDKPARVELRLSA
jgi:hypothetical protein